MRIAVLGATGKVGRLIVGQALARGHSVVALVRDPDLYAATADDRIEIRRADVTHPETFPAVEDVEVVLSALGISKADGPGALVAGAEILTARNVRVLWLGALGSGTSTGAGGGIYQAIMKMFVRAELVEKAKADDIAIRGGATVFHAPDLWVGNVSTARANVPLTSFRKPVLPPHASRATVAALMLDEAEHASRPGEILVPTAGS